MAGETTTTGAGAGAGAGAGDGADMSREDDGIPVIDLSKSEDEVIDLIAEACATYGFFQIVHHGMKVESFREEMHNYFDLPLEKKLSWKRNERNARGFFDDELTKRRRDWKQACDLGTPGSRDWDVADDDPSNACLDGWNIFPPKEDLPNFRSVFIDYFEQCAELSYRLSLLMGKGLGVSNDDVFLQDMKRHHTSYLRMNYYPPFIDGDGGDGGGGGGDDAVEETPTPKPPPPLGISPHQDAGFLTVLLQDDDCHSLQVWSNETDEWITVRPIPGALTINTGDMAMIWSNGKYRAPVHRVLTNPEKRRYSAPFFYNPGYGWSVSPLRRLLLLHPPNNDAETDVDVEQVVRYDPCLWGYFRAVRFAGDLTDLGVEIQVTDFERGRHSAHLKKQEVFAQRADFHEAFSVEKYRPLLLQGDNE